MARGGRVSAGPASRDVVCPECAHVVSSADGVPRGPFFRDPRRWLPALVVVLMVLGQVGTIHSERSWISPVLTRAPRGDQWLTATELTGVVAHNDESMGRLSSSLSAIDRSSAPDADPASQLWLYSGSLREPDTRVRWAPTYYGWPFVWAGGIDSDDFYMANGSYCITRVDSRGLAAMFREGIVPHTIRQVSCSWAGLIATASSVCFTLWLIVVIAQIIRGASLRSRSRLALLLVAVCLTVTALAIPRKLENGAVLGLDNPTYRLWTTKKLAVVSDVTLEAARELSRSRDGLVLLAQKALDAFPTGTNSRDDPLLLQFDQVTPHTHRNYLLGPPLSLSHGWLMLNEHPEPPELKQAGEWSIGFESNRLEIRLNRGAWSGVGGFVSISPPEFIATFALVWVAWFITRAAIRLLWHRRSRRRFARGQCVKCGYVLSGLKAPS